MQAIEQTIDALREMVVHAAVVAPSVSRWSVGMHVHHCCLSMIGISKTLRKSTTPKPRAQPSLRRTIVLKCGYIPRGRAESPSFVVPKESVDQEELLRLLDESVIRMREAHTMDRRHWFTHPLLGPMDRDGALKFVLVHNRHHRRIIEDILHRGGA
jgi:hypothetical protein